MNRRARQGRTAGVLFGLLLLIAMLAPLIANDQPLVAKVDGTLHFPALRSYWSRPHNPVPGKTWKRWWYELNEKGDDWAMMPLLPHGPFETDSSRINEPPVLSEGSYMGRDDTGRDVLVRLLHGASTAIWIALGTALLACLIGFPLGAWAGLRRGLADAIVLRAIEVFLCFPALFFVLAVLAFVPDSTLGMVLVLGGLSWTAVARVVRGEVINLRDADFITAARCLGVSPMGLVIRHMLPVLRGQLAVVVTMVAANAIVVESGLRFLGVGGSIDVVSWGAMLQQGRENAHLGAWHLWLFPTLAIVVTVVLLHHLADRLRPHS